MSRRWQVGAVDQPYGLCDIGFQGLKHDEEIGLIGNRARFLHPRLGRFLQRDPLGVLDGLNAYVVYHVLLGGVDPSGLKNEAGSGMGGGPGGGGGVVIAPPVRTVPPVMPTVPPPPVTIGTGGGFGLGQEVFAGLAGTAGMLYLNHLYPGGQPGNAAFATVVSGTPQKALNDRLEQAAQTMQNAQSARMAQIAQEEFCKQQGWKNCKWHHIATNKGKSFIDVFKLEFAKVGLSLDGYYNLCYVCDIGDKRFHGSNHSSPGNPYHTSVLQRIRLITSNLDTTLRQKQDLLKWMLADLCTQMNTAHNPWRIRVTK